MKTVLVAGGAGFIGSAFVRQSVAAADYRVVNLDALTYAGNLDSLAELAEDTRHCFVHGDIGDRELVGHLLREHQCDAVVNFAAESHVDRSITSPGTFVQTNVVGTFELLQTSLEYWESLDASRQSAFRFLHVSTDEVYGSLGAHGSFTENTPYRPNSPYSASKAAADHFVRAFNKTYGLPTLTTNCSNNYGPFQFPEKLIPMMILNAVAGDPLPVYGRGDNIRDWLYVDDHTRAIRQILEEAPPGEVFNIGGQCELTNLQVVQRICDFLDALSPLAPGRTRRDQIQFVTDRPGHDFRYAIDCSKVRRQLGWTPTVDFESGMHATIQWYLDNQAWVEGIRSGGYGGQRLGLVSKAELTHSDNGRQSR